MSLDAMTDTRIIRTRDADRAAEELAREHDVLAGTTGTDVKMTISVHTDGRIYVENRSGATRTVTLTFLGG
jgi:hypothetical protein